jgi:hypothetical protein
MGVAPDRVSLRFMNDLRKPEYMTRPMFGYALAHLAWFRGERKPDWARFLCWHARPDFRQSLRFLWTTGNSTFRPDALTTVGS